MRSRSRNIDRYHTVSKKREARSYAWRRWVVVSFFLLLFGTIVWRAGYLYWNESDFLGQQGNSRIQRSITVPAYRGSIVDRNGEPLAVTTPVDSVWVTPRDLLESPKAVAELAEALGISLEGLKGELEKRIKSQFWYVQRKIDPALAERIRSMNLPGVYFQREYQRFYPDGEMTAHLLGITDIDDIGLEGLELAFNDWLKGEAGKKRIIRDKGGRVVRHLEILAEARPGQTLPLTLDRRIQYMAYFELKKAILKHQAKAGSVVVMDAKSGEILALASQPPFNPNNRADYQSNRMRNRVLLDQFEPGSTIKPFTVAAALEAGVIDPNVVIDTSPGHFYLGRDQVRDFRNYGKVDLTTLMKKSSNVGASKIALKMDPDNFFQTLNQLGFGRETGIGFPGEASGTLVGRNRWSEIERATFSFGYGFSVTALQLAQAYAVLANDGVLLPAKLILSHPTPPPTRIFSSETTSEVVRIIDPIEEDDASARTARVAYYNIAGKTGTVRKLKNGSYSQSDYTAIFAGFAPVDEPRLVVVVVIDEPSGGEYYGGAVAAPVFSGVMTGALRVINAIPDNIPMVASEGRVK